MMNLAYTGEMEKKTVQEVFAQTLEELIKKDPEVVYIDADLMLLTGVKDIYKKYPKRVLNTGIQEANMASLAAGMSVLGLKPYIHSFAAFASRRTFDQLFMAAYGESNIRVIGSEPGIRQEYNGGTHMTFEDITLMRSIPNATVIDVTDSAMFSSLLWQTKDLPGMFYMRMPFKNVIRVYEEGSEFEIGRGIILKEGTDATIIACGLLVTVALQAAKLLQNEGVSVRVVDMFTVKPLDEELTVNCAKKTGAVVTAENASVYGGLGSAVSEVLGEKYPVPVLHVGVKDEFGEVGPESYLRERFGFTPENLAEKVRLAIAAKNAK
jgi:transketolase